MALFDLDQFKRINDSLGHLAGDRILKSIAVLVEEQIRKSDIIARWGGDEFVILFQKCDAATAIRLMDEIRKLIASTHKKMKPEGSLTISVGVAEYEPGDTCESLLARADNYLLDAKRKGRNLVEGKPEQLIKK